jgi:protein O-GlcNAc transferase
MEAQEQAHSKSDEKMDLSKKIEEYKQKLESDPDNVKLLSNLGAIYASLNKFDEAHELFNKILELDPKNFDGLNNIGVIYSQMGKLEEAISKLEIAVKLYPDKAKVWNNLSEAYRRAGKYHQANVARMRAIQISEKE